MITVRNIVTGLAEWTETQAAVMERFRALGGNSSRWQRRDWTAMAEALSRVEDQVETSSRGRWTAEREALRKIRRKIEDAQV